ncbi:protoheme IX farnesyltransferase [Paenibacillus swuensis]|uniref:Protoheme IX farnesyltransferase n=1 Tax=Paenibacillus swuensis TaxID=1178515 RepID=A0A172TDF1_9BACL|nr:heme o synthase [Paenibacillus swuensis]ANE45069.1 protoheme IX farnesyltransferase [Paenibacillus swuensis]
MDTPQAGVRPVWKDYITLTKPRILASNLIAAFGGFWLASKWDIDWLLLFYTLMGTTLVMASSCVFNNYLDRELDTKMERTSNRASATGRIKASSVFNYGVILGVAGLLVLWLLVSNLAAILGIIGMIVYVGIYTAWLKRTSTLSTAVGGLSGAMPPVIGYCAVSGTMDIGAWLLIAILFLWQPPHFWALGIYRREEYRAAGFPLLPVVKGVHRTKIQMIPYIVLLIVADAALYYYGYVGWIFLIVTTVLGVYWLISALSGFKAKDDDAWARKNFKLSVNFLMILFLVMIIDTVSV